MKRYFPIQWTEEEQKFAKKIQKEMSKPEDGMANSILPIPTTTEIGGSSDVGDVSWNVPTMGAVYSAWPLHVAPHQWGCTACNGMSIGRKAVTHVAKVLAATGLDLLTDPNLLKRIQEEFAARTKDTIYKSLNELDKPLEGALDEKERSHYECCIQATMEHFGIKK